MTVCEWERERFYSSKRFKRKLGSVETEKNRGRDVNKDRNIGN